jgi:hypothetical protein
MIRLAAVIGQFESEFLATYKHQVLPSHKKALQP